MLTNNKIVETVKKQLAIEYNCSIIDFETNENIITLPGFSNERRKFADKPHFFKMVTMGGNAVISADEKLHDWLNKFTKDKYGHWLFEHPNLREIDKKLEAYSKQLYQTHHMFLPLGQAKQSSVSIQVKWYEQDEIHQFYSMGKFPNAFCLEYKPERPDVLAIAAIENDEIIGMAGCSADTPIMWQVGIDVDVNHRGKGIGARLVSLLKDEILIRGKIPYYGTSLSNLHSWNIAINCGFIPSWIEVATKE
ncbi:MAG: GNAT family N-acetyltransferase [Oscillospiraceae bacterium]|nr:GNAT family N-acetyltransferase [Oscillospiraceae bacterium]